MALIRTIAIALALAGLAAPSLVTEAKTAPPAAAASSDPQTALATLNAYRKSKGLGAVALDPTLTKMAQALADTCAKAGACDHSTGGSFPQRAAAYGFRNVYGGENIMKNAATVAEAFAWWQSSSVHNANMLLKPVTRIGFARAPATGRAFWVLVLTSDPS